MVTTSIVKCESIEELNQVVVVEVLVLHLRDLQCHKQKLLVAQSSETKLLNRSNSSVGKISSSITKVILNSNLNSTKAI